MRMVAYVIFVNCEISLIDNLPVVGHFSEAWTDSVKVVNQELTHRIPMA